MTTEITSSHNEQLKEVRKLAGRRWRDKLGEFVAEGEDLLEAADAAGWESSARYAASGSGLPGVPVLPHVLADVSQLGSGTRALAVYPDRGAWRRIQHAGMRQDPSWDASAREYVKVYEVALGGPH